VIEARIFRIGLTGGIGSGKSTVAERFQRLGAALVDTDVIAHRLTASGGDAIEGLRLRFGDEMIAHDGSLDRAAMRALVFAKPDARRVLESVLHPMIGAVARDEVAAAARAGAPYVILAIPLLVESGKAKDRVERILVVDCPEDVQVARVAKRSGLDPAQVQAIIRAQASRAQRLQAAQDVIDNGGDESRLDAQVQPLHERYVALGRAWSADTSEV
jgi:dephospho-CoA kinase